MKLTEFNKVLLNKVSAEDIKERMDDPEQTLSKERVLFLEELVDNDSVGVLIKQILTLTTQNMLHIRLCISRDGFE